MAPVTGKVFPENFPANLKFNEVVKRMKEHKGRLIWVEPGRQYFRILRVSKKPLSKLRFRKKSMVEYYKKRHNVDLKYLNYPVFNCTNSAKIPPEVALLEEDEKYEEIGDESWVS
jgi:hypothetical protein